MPSTIALIGNPNTGKSTLFNALCGVRQRVGNYPGVTVEKKIGKLEIEGEPYVLVDLPGSYSLAPRSPDEMVAVDVLFGRFEDVGKVDVVACILDASNLPRNLYLASQILEVGLPTVLALNMSDVAASRGQTIDVQRLERQIGYPIIPLQANRKIGIADLKRALAANAGAKATPPESPFPAPFREEVSHLAEMLAQHDSPPPRYLVERLLLDTNGYLAQSGLFKIDESLESEIAAARERLSKQGCPVPGVEAMSRYEWVGKVMDGVVKHAAERPVTLSDRLDRILTHRVWGTLFFVLVMGIVFQSIFAWAVPAMDLIDGAFGAVGDLVLSAMPEGALRSLLVDGVIGGVGGVLVFLPQIFILFFFISLLEDCGYMARAAYLMDRVMSQVGLSGKSFIPLLSSFACAIPGVMAARVIENSRDRLTTILVAPLMSCSARLPVYALLIAAFIPKYQWLGGWIGLQGIVMFAMYAIGALTAAVVALVLKRTLLKGPTPPFIMELPPYKAPSISTVVHRMFERGWSFIKRAGTVILAVTIIVWAASYFPRNEAAVEGPHLSELETLRSRQEQLEERIADADESVEERVALSLAATNEQLEQLESHIASEHLKNSLLGRMGQWVEPVVRPLGWDWRIGCAAIASFPAREVVVGTLGVIYSLGADQDEASVSLREKLREARWDDTGKPVFTIPTALSLMVFFALCAQCAATLVVIRRETGAWKWAVFTFVYMTALAYLAALATYQIGTRLF